MPVIQDSSLASFFLTVMRQARASFSGEADAAQSGAALIEALDQACARARDRGHDQSSVGSALFAVVAWIDETAMTSPWPGAGHWRLTPLQRHYFGTTRAGSEFYQRLQALPEEATQVREVYGLVLVAGFQGEYAARAPGEFESWRVQLLEQIRQEQGMPGFAAGQSLFPQAQAGGAAPPRPAGRLTGRPSGYTVTLLVAPLLILLVLYLYLDQSLAALAGALLTDH
ncbi:MAG TPA: DotU family type IV/VI secretion system protein [Alcaligenes sp.]|nr:DotU family type IV/VI secretion system protein [Alcaligenes sp.]HRL27890.1 DotU family type IV/VI secretion system protein [Alcaligenes sp.]